MDWERLSNAANQGQRRGRNNGKPLTGPDLDRFLPWNADPADLRTWAQPHPPG